jgi:pSer/pThr/pTyr-binding forkhead associated (FHA) protein
MQARLTAYLPDHAALARVIVPAGPLRIGRAAGSDVVIDHPSISREHAGLEPRDDAWILRDLHSKNGCFVDGTAVTEARLDHACWLRLGDVFCEFTPLSPADVLAFESGARARRVAATAHTLRIDGAQRLDDLLDASLRGVLDLAQCERGFVLLESGDGFQVRASLALDPSALADRAFSGSVGAVRRALADRSSVVVNDVGQEAWLAGRESVVAGGLSAVVCLPLRDGDATLGAIYADRVGRGPAITALDLELLEAFVERVALWLSVRRASRILAEPVPAAPSTPHWSGILAAHPAEDHQPEQAA